MTALVSTGHVGLCLDVKGERGWQIIISRNKDIVSVKHLRSSRCLADTSKKTKQFEFDWELQIDVDLAGTELDVAKIVLQVTSVRAEGPVSLFEGLSLNSRAPEISIDDGDTSISPPFNFSHLASGKNALITLPTSFRHESTGLEGLREQALLHEAERVSIGCCGKRSLSSPSIEFPLQRVTTV